MLFKLPPAETQVGFHGRLSGVMQAQFLYNKTGKHKVDKL